MLGETVACATVSQHLYILSYIQVRCYPPLRQLHSVFGDLNNGVCHVMKITFAESHPVMGLLAQQTFCVGPEGLARAYRMPRVTKRG